MSESELRNIRWTQEQIAFIDAARGKRDFAEYVRSAALEIAGKKLKRKVPETRGRGRPPKT